MAITEGRLHQSMIAMKKWFESIQNEFALTFCQIIVEWSKTRFLGRVYIQALWVQSFSLMKASYLIQKSRNSGECQNNDIIFTNKVPILVLYYNASELRVYLFPKFFHIKCVRFLAYNYAFRESKNINDFEKSSCRAGFYLFNILLIISIILQIELMT